jgi:hypothetical protein
MSDRIEEYRTEQPPEFRDGRALHVDRLALRGAVIAEAVPNFRSFGVA